MTRSSSHPTIALVGRPNVGKSTLFNRLAGGRRALVASTPGVTRDRREEWVTKGPYRFRLIDTGGISFDKNGAFSEAITEQVAVGVEEADCLWMVTDGVEGLSPFDEEMHRWLLRRGKPMMVLVNKSDNSQRSANVAEFYAMGTERVQAISALHGTGIEAALAGTAEMLPAMLEDHPEPEQPAASGPIRIALVGRPNVGKSSLANRILAETRMIVSDVPGTTREAVELPLEYGGQEYLLIDTAGIRRKARTREHLDKVGALNAISSLERAEVAVLVLDATEPPSDQDARIANYILEQRRGMVVALNKWDQVPGGKEAAKELEENIRYKLRFAAFAPLVRTSALRGMGIERLFTEIQAAYQQYTRRVQTADLNRVVEMCVIRRPPPARGHSTTKVFYGSQVHHSPPTFCFFTNHLKEIGDNYSRFMENQLRYHFGFKGTPINILWKGRREEGKDTRRKKG